MYVCYALTVALIFTTEFLGWPAFWGATLFVALMSLLMLMDINPRYRFEDIDTLDLRVCYNGEWYYVRALSDSAIAEILNSAQTPGHVKQGIEKLLALKGEVDFYDVYHLTWGQRRASGVQVSASAISSPSSETASSCASPHAHDVLKRK